MKRSVDRHKDGRLASSQERVNLCSCFLLMGLRQWLPYSLLLQISNPGDASADRADRPFHELCLVRTALTGCLLLSGTESTLSGHCRGITLRFTCFQVLCPAWLSRSTTLSP